MISFQGVRAMTSEEQEALSHQHYGYWTVPLASGSIAVFTHPNGKLLAIVHSWNEVLKQLMASKPVYQRKLTMETGVNLDDLL
jgi:hypothetical protein